MFQSFSNVTLPYFIYFPQALTYFIFLLQGDYVTSKVKSINLTMFSFYTLHRRLPVWIILHNWCNLVAGPRRSPVWRSRRNVSLSCQPNIKIMAGVCVSVSSLTYPCRFRPDTSLTRHKYNSKYFYGIWTSLYSSSKMQADKLALITLL